MTTAAVPCEHTPELFRTTDGWKGHCSCGWLSDTVRLRSSVLVAWCRAHKQPETEEQA